MNVLRSRYAATTKAQSRDTAMVAALCCCVASAVLQDPRYALGAAAVLLAAMLYPAVFRPVACVWLGLGEGLGRVTSRVILAAVFLCLITPVGLLRRLIGADPMARREWKKGTQSAFQVREHTYTADDLKQMF